METQKAAQELKAERVQQEIVLEEPFEISLKAERVQESLSPAGKVSSLYQISLNQMRDVTIDFYEPQVVVTLFANGLKA